MNHEPPVDPGVWNIVQSLRMVVVELCERAGVWRREGGKFLPPFRFMSRRDFFAIDTVLTIVESALRRLIVVVAAGLVEAGFRVEVRTRAAKDRAQAALQDEEPAASASPQDAESRAKSNPRISAPAGTSGRGTWFDPHAGKRDNPFARTPDAEPPARRFPGFKTGDNGGWIVPGPVFGLFDPPKNFNAYWRELAMSDEDREAAEREREQGFFEAEEANDRRDSETFIPDLMPSAPIVYRLIALNEALHDIVGQAKRLLALQARPLPKPPKYQRVDPLRTGFPPGWRKRRLHEADRVLRDCHRWALDIQNPVAQIPSRPGPGAPAPDTS